MRFLFLPAIGLPSNNDSGQVQIGQAVIFFNSPVTKLAKFSLWLMEQGPSGSSPEILVKRSYFCFNFRHRSGDLYLKWIPDLRQKFKMSSNQGNPKS